MALTRIERNQIFEAIAASSLDPAECSLSENGKFVIVTHNGSDSTVSYAPMVVTHRPIWRVSYRVADGHHHVYQRERELEKVTPIITQWANEVKEITDAPDLWADLQRSRELISDIQQADSSNTPFTQDEQRQIATQLKEIKNQLKEQLELTSEQVEQIGERLDEAQEASTRMGRKDWLLLFGGTILNLIVTDTITPGVAGRIFTTAVHGLIHLFTGAGGPPQILG